MNNVMTVVNVNLIVVISMSVIHLRNARVKQTICVILDIDVLIESVLLILPLNSNKLMIIVNRMMIVSLNVVLLMVTIVQNPCSVLSDVKGNFLFG